jgi:hypothetical protein
VAINIDPLSDLSCRDRGRESERPPFRKRMTSLNNQTTLEGGSSWPHRISYDW